MEAAENNSVYIDNNFFQPSLERLRMILMFFMCINLVGFPTRFGEIAQKLTVFAPIAFFILSGYLVLRECPNRSARILRAIKRTAIVFAVLTVVYFVINMLFYRKLGVNIFDAFASKRVWFNFIVLNVWPFDIGGAIWYVQSLLYAYIIIYILEKLKLLKLDWLISILLILFTVVTGELCGVLRWNIAGYTYLPANFLTRALPYVLLGCFIYRNINYFGGILRGIYKGGIILGFALAIGEITLLGYLKVPGYYGHLIGMSLAAFSMCMLAFQDDLPDPGFEIIFNGNRWYSNVIYYLCQPLSTGLALLISIFWRSKFTTLSGWLGIITFAICTIFLCFAAFTERLLFRRKADA